jgi:hypothetical protein
MKIRASVILVLLAVIGLVLSGCASNQPAGKPSARKYVPDAEYIAAVEREARRMPVTVIWVNPPMKKVEDGDN